MDHRIPRSFSGETKSLSQRLTPPSASRNRAAQFFEIHCRPRPLWGAATKYRPSPATNPSPPAPPALPSSRRRYAIGVGAGCALRAFPPPLPVLQPPNDVNVAFGPLGAEHDPNPAPGPSRKSAPPRSVTPFRTSPVPFGPLARSGFVFSPLSPAAPLVMREQWLRPRWPFGHLPPWVAGPPPRTSWGSPRPPLVGLIYGGKRMGGGGGDWGGGGGGVWGGMSFVLFFSFLRLLFFAANPGHSREGFRQCSSTWPRR